MSGLQPKASVLRAKQTYVYILHENKSQVQLKMLCLPAKGEWNTYTPVQHPYFSKRMFTNLTSLILCSFSADKSVLEIWSDKKHYSVTNYFPVNHVKKNQLDAELILSIFRHPLHVWGISMPIIRRYNRMYTAVVLIILFRWLSVVLVGQPGQQTVI